MAMQEALSVTGIDRRGKVLATRRLAPRRVVWIRGAHWMLELPVNEASPSVGDEIRIMRPLT